MNEKTKNRLMCVGLLVAIVGGLALLRIVAYPTYVQQQAMEKQQREQATQATEQRRKDALPQPMPTPVPTPTNAELATSIRQQLDELKTPTGTPTDKTGIVARMAVFTALSSLAVEARQRHDSTLTKLAGALDRNSCGHNRVSFQN